MNLPYEQEIARLDRLFSVEKYHKTRSRFLRKNQHFFRQTNVLNKQVQVTKELISRNFLSVIAFCVFVF